MKVMYQWSEDGEVEQCYMEKTNAFGSFICDHCGCEVNKNEPIAILSAEDDTYMMHESCAEKSCTLVK